MAQLWFCTVRPSVAVVSALKVPVGASVCPKRLFPQHVMVLSVRSPQAFEGLPVTLLKVPAGASAGDEPSHPRSDSEFRNSL